MNKYSRTKKNEHIQSSEEKCSDFSAVTVSVNIIMFKNKKYIKIYKSILFLIYVKNMLCLYIVKRGKMNKYSRVRKYKQIQSSEEI